MNRVQQALAGLPGVESVHTLGEDNFLIKHQPNLSEAEILNSIMSKVVAPGTRKALGKFGDIINPG